MASYFSSPVIWDPAMIQPITDSENVMTIESAAGKIQARAMHNGFVIFRPQGSPPVTQGNLELVLQPGIWGESLRASFRESKWTELPPGRIVYREVAVAIVKKGLAKLIADSYATYQGARTNIHPSLFFVPNPGKPDWLYQVLDKISEEALSETEKEKKINEQIEAALNTFLSESQKDTFAGFKVKRADILFTIDPPNAQVKLEIRNLYGEPLHPHYYLRRLGESETELAPTPPFPAAPPSDANPQARTKSPGRALLVRIPKVGGTRFSLIGYESRLVWDYTYDAATNVYALGVDIRPGANVTVPVFDFARVPSLVKNIWDTHHSHINKYAEVFYVPGEIIVATIFVEGRREAGFPDLNSIHIEPYLRETYPADYEILLAQTRVAGALLTEAAVRAYWEMAGGWALNRRGLAYQPNSREVEEAARTVIAKHPLSSKDKLGSTGSRKKITYEQLTEIILAIPDLVKPVTFQLPLLSKTKDKTKYHYDLIKNDPGLGEKVARIYWISVGGVRMNAGKEEIQAATELEIFPPLPPTDLSVVYLADPDNTALTVTWGQILQILSILRDAAMAPPQVIYQLEPLKGTVEYEYQKLYLMKELKVRMPAATDDQINDIVDRYTQLMGKSVRYSNNVRSGGVPGIELENKPAGGAPDPHLNMDEIKLISKILPARISIGIQQTLFDTAARLIIPWIKDHYGNNFFQTVSGTATNPPNSIEDIVTWIWDNVWGKAELEIVMLVGYIKRNAVFYWEGMKKYRVGERMTMFDFPRVAAAYNSGEIKKPGEENTKPNKEHYSDWGLHFYDNYLAENKQGFSALIHAASLFSQIALGDPKEARVRLRPDLEENSGMEPR